MYIRKMFLLYTNTQLDNYVLMPDHIHILFTIIDKDETSKAQTVPRMVRWLKSHVTTQLQTDIFQKNCYDTIADTQKRFDNCYNYIVNNPAAWLQNPGKEPF